MEKRRVKLKPNTTLSAVSTIRFQKRLLILLDERWCEIFDSANPTFEAVIDKNGNYTLRGPMVHQHHRRIPAVAQEDTVDG